MTGFNQPKRILWYKSDGTPYRVDSVPHGTDADRYAEGIRRIEGHKLEYTVLED